MLRRPLLALSIAAAAAHASAQGDVVAGDRGALLDAAVQRAAPGFCGGCAVALDGQLLLAKGYGEREQKPLSARSPFALGGLSRLFTVAAALRLLQDRKLQADQPLLRYLDDWRGDRALTVGELLEQRSRLPAQAPGLDAAGGRRPAVAAIGRAQPAATAGYSPLADVLLAALVEDTAGMRFEAYVERRLLQPCGLRDTGFDVGLDWSRRGALGMHASLLDLHALLLALHQGTLLPAAAQAPLWLPVAGDGDYALAKLPLGGRELLVLNGRSADARVRVLLQPQAGAWVILCGGKDAPLDALQPALAVALLQAGAVAEPAAAAPAAPAAPTLPVDDAAAARFAGCYELPLGGRFAIEAQGGQLWLCGEGLQASARVAFGCWPPPGGDELLRRAAELGLLHLQALQQGDAAGIAAGFAGDDAGVRARKVWADVVAAHGEVRGVRCLGTEPGPPAVTWFAVDCARGSATLCGTWAEARRLAFLKPAPGPLPFRVPLQLLRPDVAAARLGNGRALALSIEGLPGGRTLVFEDATPGADGLLDCREIR